VQRLDPKLDIVFKLLLTHEPALLVDMLQGILAKPIGAVTVLDAGIRGEQVGDKRVDLDLRVAVDDGSRADVEMQIRTAPALASRLMYYGARDYADQLTRGDAYERLTPTIVIAWLVQPLFPSIDRLHSVFELCERHTHTLFSDQLAIHVLQLSALSPSLATGYDAQVARWARFLTARDDVELDQLASEDPIMTLAKQTLDQLSQDPAVQRLARERADAIKLYKLELLANRIEARAEGVAEGRAEGVAEGRAEGVAEGRAEGVAEGRAEGVAEGRAEGVANVLLKLLGLRFGPPSEATRARVEMATLEQLDAWTERVLTAQTVDEALAP
jgi:predicted transposase/invertase (TIGR01784 family)